MVRIPSGNKPGRVDDRRFPFDIQQSQWKYDTSKHPGQPITPQSPEFYDRCLAQANWHMKNMPYPNEQARKFPQFLWHPLTHIPKLIHLYPPICNYIILPSDPNNFTDDDAKYAPFTVLQVQHRSHLILSFPGISVREIILIATHYHDSGPFNNQDGYYTGRYTRHVRSFYITIRYHITYEGVVLYNSDEALPQSNTIFYLKPTTTSETLPANHPRSSPMILVNK